MKKLGAIVIFSLLFMPLLGPIMAEASTYDVIVVRGDILIDYTVAQAYSQKEKIPILLTDPRTLSGFSKRELMGFYDEGARKVLIIGGRTDAISEEIELEIANIGYEVTRIWDWDRAGTAARVAIDLWKSSRESVIINGSIEESYLIASKFAMKRGIPILITNENSLPASTQDALEKINARKVYVVGPMISDNVVKTLSSKGITVERLGKDINISDIVDLKEEGLNLQIDILSLLGGLIIGALSLLLIFRFKKDNSVPVFVLTEDERKLVQALKNGEDRQEKLPEATNFSRPKVTRLVMDLESKGIIFREKKGKTYKIKLDKPIKDTR
ncbi:MAG: putative cell wall binding repeat 2 [Candidatus Methanofastidiosum methylothiophilum]|uniref:Putative cell wall binding repeat 2 n=1 Tax=Candidatus Methanofastidiosum methylothiophilum TaxID=1705564 RepID=A0A150IUC9_9EURY|nr:MAG: putative cell wall binding repeat 2 [Candidatus Methanofastidiosum methylthiophilus]KYC48611.1 MAG: putative cell wall binding repeat 2 [Candidatus Methanofastidiosum methylthiophilus]KYC51184.1 MAG: putative cell wall binding repeat 2 [Candidatus Methanofastidiosum methylthiophilus]